MKKRFGFLLATVVASLMGASSVQAQAQVKVPDDINALLNKYTCFACHRADARLVGPAYVDVAKKGYKNDRIVELIYKPEPANWPGYPPMAPMTQVPKEDAMKLAVWINSLAPKAAATKKKS
jgi:cytochrome c